LRNLGNTDFPKISKRKAWRIKFKIFFIGFLFLEIALRCFGFRAGTSINALRYQENPIYEERFVSDEKGINHLNPNAKNLMLGTVINHQGFRGSFDYTKKVVDSIRLKTKKEIIMIIGDSFVEGCCADTVTNSFPDLLNRDPRYCVLNFGVAGTDPTQYLLVAEKYVKELKPDKVIITFYFGNDIFSFYRKPSPGTPLTFPFKDNLWLFSCTDNNISLKNNYTLKNPDEAFEFYIDNYTLFGSNRNFLEKVISYSVCFSKLYLAVEHKLSQRKWVKIKSKLGIKSPESPEKITNDILTNIKSACYSAEVPVIFVGIPSPKEASKGNALKYQYPLMLKGLNIYMPEGFSLNDYDGKSIGNHFNNEGHKKYAEFLKGLLELKSRN
jgi:hypothetical protein